MIQLKPDQARLSALLKDTITLMCKNGLTFNSKFSIDCVIGVTLDEKEAFYISMNNIIKSEEANMGSDTSQEESHSGHPRKKRRKRSRSRECKTELGGNMGDSMGEEGPSLPSKRELSDEDSEDNAIVFIKEEPKGWDQSPDTFQNPVHSEPQLDSHGGFPYTGADISQDSNLSLGDTFMPMSNQHMLQGSSGGSPYPPHTVGGQPPGGIAGGLTSQSPGQSSQTDLEEQYGPLPPGHFSMPLPSTANNAKPKKRCRVCYMEGKRREVPNFCAGCVGMPGLCPGKCFYYYHTFPENKLPKRAVMPDSVCHDTLTERPITSNLYKTILDQSHLQLDSEKE